MVKTKFTATLEVVIAAVLASVATGCGPGLSDAQKLYPRDLREGSRTSAYSEPDTNTPLLEVPERNYANTKDYRSRTSENNSNSIYEIDCYPYSFAVEPAAENWLKLRTNIMQRIFNVRFNDQLMGDYFMILSTASAEDEGLNPRATPFISVDDIEATGMENLPCQPTEAHVLAFSAATGLPMPNYDEPELSEHTYAKFNQPKLDTVYNRPQMSGRTEMPVPRCRGDYNGVRRKNGRS